MGVSEWRARSHSKTSHNNKHFYHRSLPVIRGHNGTRDSKTGCALLCVNFLVIERYTIYNERTVLTLVLIVLYDHS